LTEHATPIAIAGVFTPVAGTVATGAEAKAGAIHAPEAVSVHVAGKPRETHEVKLVVEAADPANGIQTMVADPLR
jgi:hypothetical protein